MDKYITAEVAKATEFTLRNSRDQEVTLSLWNIIQQDKECSDFCFFPVQLAQIPEPKEGDWLEAVQVPVFNGRRNPETGEDEFCEPYWDVKDGLYSTDAYLETMFWHDGVWHHASSYRPEIVRSMHWSEFKSPLFK